jgi:peroxiredoxin/tetratricopeptide (TPR) repeat protein
MIKYAQITRLASSAFLLTLLSIWAAIAIPLHAQETAPTTPPTEQDPAIPAAGHSLHGEAFNDGPRQRAVLLPGMGEVDFPITTESPEAQAFFNQGVAQLHTFYYLEAERSFRQAALLDPASPMTYWGMAMANTNNQKRAREFQKKARTKAHNSAISRRETLYLDALEAKLSESGDDRSRRQNWLAGLETIVQEFPEDIEARLFLAMVTWDNQGKGDGIGSRQALEELIRSAERVAPMHPGVHHYRIHLWDSGKSRMAEKSAGLYALAAPGIAHAWHMPGHTYTNLKRYRDAAYQQEGSARIDHAAMTRDRIMPFEIHNYAHNNQWLVTSLSHAGRAREAIAVARNLVEQPRDPQKNTKSDGGSPQRNGRARWSEVLTRYELWDDLIEATESGALDWSDVPEEKKEKSYTLGLAYAARSDLPRLQEQIDALKTIGRAERPPVDDDFAPPAKTDDQAKKPDDKAEEAKSADAVAESEPSRSGDRPRRRRGRGPTDLKAKQAELEAWLLLVQGRQSEALKRLDQATSMRPESRARFQLRAGQVDTAVETARKAVTDNENQVPPLACAVEVLHAAGKHDEARSHYERLIKLISQPDPSLPVFQRISSISQTWNSAPAVSPTPPDQNPTQSARNRADLEDLGPLIWSPYVAPRLTLANAEGKTWTLEDHHGRNVLLLFFLGGQCAHCMDQLRKFSAEIEALAQLDVDVVAISSDNAGETRALAQNKDGITFAMPLLPDPTLDAFKAYRCFDDFESLPLHGIFLIDPTGAVRYQRISADPFLDVDFIKLEAARVNRLLDHDPHPAPSSTPPVTSAR